MNTGNKHLSFSVFDAKKKYNSNQLIIFFLLNLAAIWCTQFHVLFLSS